MTHTQGEFKWQQGVARSIDRAEAFPRFPHSFPLQTPSLLTKCAFVRRRQVGRHCARPDIVPPSSQCTCRPHKQQRPG